MPDNIPDKKPLREDEFIPQAGDGALQEIPGEDEEHDLDDLVHTGSPSKPVAGEEIDADDAVHNASRDSSKDHDDERDPDDLVHGN